MDVDVSALGMRASSETYEHIGAVPVWVHDLSRRWQEEESRTRVIVGERQAASRSSLPCRAELLPARSSRSYPAKHLTHF
jgi:hypothetical protein